MVLGPLAGSIFPLRLSDSSAQSHSASSIVPHPFPSHTDEHNKDGHSLVSGFKTGPDGDDSIEERPPYLHAMLAGGLGGTTGDMLMHTIDTVKTRQQGDPHVPPRYTSMGPSYLTILRQEGIRGLYGGITPAFLGSFSGTVLFFGGYEWSKRKMIDCGVTPSIAYLAGGLVADLVASPIYVPSEVLKTRLQLQGRFNNPYFNSGYNYRSLRHAISSIYRTEGLSAFFHGYKATLVRDLPFSALQFSFYEQERALAKAWVGGSNDIGILLEILTGASAGGLAGVITCPLDVVKTRVQTQRRKDGPEPRVKVDTMAQGRGHCTATVPHFPSGVTKGSISNAAMLDTSSVFTGLKLIYRTEGIAGWFRGVGPRAIWTSVQSGTMLVLYQALLRQLEQRSIISKDLDELSGSNWSTD